MMRLWSNDQDNGTVAIPISIKTSQIWESQDSVHQKVANGSWDASDLVGRGGCVCFRGGDQCFRLNGFKPFAQNIGTTGYNEGDKGDGEWINPWFKAGSMDIQWEIFSFRAGGLFTIASTADGNQYMAGGSNGSSSSDSSASSDSSSTATANV
jgi:hypothetical protein